MKKIIIILLILFSTLLIIDLASGIWYWNRLNLLFDSTEFNNILTPTISFFAFIIYGLALFMTIKQNKIILSQNIKPHYENEIERYLLKAKQISIKNHFDPESKTVNGFDYVDLIQDKLLSLTKNKDYNEDLKKYKQGISMNKEYFKKRSYFVTLTFLTDFTIGFNPINFLYLDLERFITEINLSKLIEEDKILIKKKIRNLFLDKYMTIINMTKTYDFYKVLIPIYYNTDGKVEFKNIAETEFGKHYDWFKKELN